MAISLSSLRRTSVRRPPRLFLYGIHGVGKSTFAAAAPNPVFIQTEDGLGALDVQAFPLAKSFDDVMESIGSLYEEEHDFSTLCIDSVDWLEQLIFRDVAAEQKVSSIEDIGYGKGYVFASSRWATLLEGLDLLRNEKNMAIALIGHAQIRRFEDPMVDGYDRYSPDLHKVASATLCEWSDVVAFVNFRVATKQIDAGFNRKVAKGVGSGTRTMYLEERPAFTAKSRWRIGSDCPLDWATFEARLNKAQGGEDAAPAEQSEPDQPQPAQDAPQKSAVKRGTKKE
jgi:hypothetical protein